jgi:hypothetical protein
MTDSDRLGRFYHAKRFCIILALNIWCFKCFAGGSYAFAACHDSVMTGCC